MFNKHSDKSHDYTLKIMQLYTDITRYNMVAHVSGHGVNRQVRLSMHRLWSP